METEKIIRSSQEQAVGAWINYLNQVRLDRLTSALAQQNINFASAMDTIEQAFTTISEEIIQRNRGGSDGMHGFIAEIAEHGIGNAREQIVGNSPIYVWINDNGPVDLQRGAEAIQQKFVQSGGHLSMQAIMEHLRHYPDFLSNGGKYQIPKDHYEKIMAYLNMPADQANKLPTSTGEFSLKQWKEVQAFFGSGEINQSQLEPSILEYREVQRGTIGDTIEGEKENLRNIDQERRDSAYQDSKPTLAEGAKATVVGAAVEGLTSFCVAVVHKRKTGKKLKEFNEADWIDIAGDSGKGFLKGGIRGASIYFLTNYTATPAAVASAITTASFGVAEQAHLLRSGTITEVQFIENSEMLCLDASVSALASFAGQVLIPIPVLGAIIGNAVGMMMYQIGKDNLSAKENEMIETYLRDLRELDERLLDEYGRHIEKLNACYAEYMSVLAVAFDPDVNRALNGSVDLAKRMGVPSTEILDSYDKIVSFFMD